MNWKCWRHWLAQRGTAEVGQNLSRAMLCLEGKHIKALSTSSLWQGCSWGRSWISFYFLPTPSRIILFLACCSPPHPVQFRGTVTCCVYFPRPRQRQHQHIRSTWLTTPKNTWPRYSRTGEAFGANEALCSPRGTRQSHAHVDTGGCSCQSLGNPSCIYLLPGPGFTLAVEEGNCSSAGGNTSVLRRESCVVLSFFALLGDSR